MQLPFKFFYRQFGVRRVLNMVSPKLVTLSAFPIGSMLHYLTYDSEHPDLDVSQLYFGANTRRVLVDYPEEITPESKGKPRKTSSILKSLFRPFHVKNKKFRYLKDHYKTQDDKRALTVENYNYLYRMWRYTDLPMSRYYQWWDIQRTVWDNVQRINTEADYNHFFLVQVPEDVPSLSFLQLYSRQMNVNVMKIFDTPNKLFILELFKWLSGENRETTVFGSLKPETLSKVNLVFTSRDGRSSVVNLGYLDSWIKDHENRTEFNTVTQVVPLVLQKVMIKFLIAINSTVEVVETPEQTQTTVDPADEQERLELEAAQREYDEEHSESDGDHPDEHEYRDDVSRTEVVTSLAKTSKIDPVNKDMLAGAMDEADNNDLESTLKDIDDELKVLETVVTKRLKDKGVQVDSKGDIIEENLGKKEISVQEIREKIFNEETVEQSLRRQVDQSADYGLLSASDYKRFIKDIEAYKELPDPYGSGKPAVQAMVITPEMLKLDQEKTRVEASELVLDKSMLQSSLLSYDHDYITKLLPKDIVSMTGSLQKAGVVIRRHEIEVDHSALGTYENHTLELRPIDGQASTVRFRIPKVEEDGTFVANGNKYVMRKQRVDLPIRKINPTSVALTSYYGKTFVSLNAKKSNSSLEWIIKKLNEASMEDHPYIKRVAPAKVFDNNFEAPYIYNALADNFKTITTTKYVLTFDHTERSKMVNEVQLAKLEENGSRVVGMTTKHQPIVVNRDNHFFVVDQNGSLVSIGDIYEVLQLDMAQAPVDFTEVRIFSKTVPVAVILGHSIGFENLVKMLGAKYRKTEGRQQKNLEPHEYAISFKDESYIFTRKQRVPSMILAGFLEYERLLRQYMVEDFNHKDVYMTLLESKGLSSIYIREIEMTQQLFVDAITKGILESMGEPVTFNGLLIRSTELLQTYHHPDTQDMHAMRVRGYERLAGVIYKEMAAAIRQYRNRNIAGKSKIDISPYQIWGTIMKDPAIKLVEDINPIQNLKETEIVTYVGEGGRTKDSLSKPSRAYHANDMGIVSEATVDSSDVGINAYLSASPTFQDMRGVPQKGSKKITATQLVSTSALLAPGAAHDDPKRVNFISIQQSHTIATAGYHQPLVRTGYEYVIGNRTTDMFCYCAKQDGKVVGVTESGIIVEYADGTQKGVTLGRVYGKAEGSVYPHDIVTPMKIGQKFKKGDTVAYNTGFFEPDLLDPKRVVMKNSMLVTTALYESNQTHEDSSVISKALSRRLSAKTTKVKSFVINFNQNLLDVVKPGQAVNPKDVLMIIEDEITSTNNVFDEESLRVLKRLSNQAPRANFLGTVDKIEVYYHGDKRDMTASLKALADRSDRILAETCRSSGKPVMTGQVNDEYRVSGVPLALDKAELKFYITIETPAGVGDKNVFANQMKSVVGEVMDYSMTTESGTPIDAVFGMRSIMARVVNSPALIGTTSTLLKVVAKRAAEIYRS